MTVSSPARPARTRRAGGSPLPVALAVAAVLALGTAGLSACGGSSGTGSDSPGTTVPEAAKPAPGAGADGTSRGPASAGDKRGKAPDDVISDRPGGPKAPGSPQPQ